MSLIYLPAEDSYLMQEILEKELKRSLRKNSELKFLEIGIGSGIQLECAKKIGVENIFGVDINKEAVTLCKKNNFNVWKSNLFSKIKEKYDIIVFNPPYLPLDKREDKESRIATTGGKLGGELINKFLKQAKKHLEKNGKIFLLISSLTKGIDWQNWKKKKLAEKKVFMETLEVWELES